MSNIAPSPILEMMDRIREEGLIAIVRGGFSLEEVLTVGDAMLAAPLPLLEVTLNTTGALNAIEALRIRFGDHMGGDRSRDGKGFWAGKGGHICRRTVPSGSQSRLTYGKGSACPRYANVAWGLYAFGNPAGSPGRLPDGETLPVFRYVLFESRARTFK